jgi:hypothetical protein
VRQNIGLILLTGGSILLAISIFRVYRIEFIKFGEWKNVPWESRFILRLFSKFNKENFLKRIYVLHEKWPVGKPLTNLTLAERFYLNIPAYAVMFMIVGMFLCFDYTALRGVNMIVSKWTLTIIGCSLTVLGVVLRYVGNLVRGYDEYGHLRVFKPDPEDRRKSGIWGTRLHRLGLWCLTFGPVIQLVAAVMK